MGSRPDGWWRDRAGAAVRLHGEIARLATSGRLVLPGDAGPADDIELVLVLEGAAKAAAARIRAAEATETTAAKGGTQATQAKQAVAAAQDATHGPEPTRATHEGSAPRIRVVAAPGSGDDTIVALARRPDARNPDAPEPDARYPDAPEPDARQPDARNPDTRQPDTRRVVITADRELGERSRAAGAEVLSPGWLLRLLRSE